MSIAENLKRLRTASGKSQPQLAEESGVSQQLISQIENNKNTTTKFLPALARALGVSVFAIDPSYAIDVDPFASRPPAPPAPIVQEAIPGRDMHKADLGPGDVPVLGVSIGGSDSEDDDRNPDFWLNGEHVDHVRRPAGLANRRHVFAIYVRGESMIPRYKEGELLFVEKTKAPMIGDDVVIELKPKSEGSEHASFVKELVRRRGSYMIVKQFNPPKELEFDQREIENVFRVIPTKEWVG